MASLSKAQMDFLASQGVSVGQLYDATGQTKDQYQSAMKRLGKSFAYGVTPCRKGGHTLRSRAGHCIQCDTSVIAYQLRNDADGIVYIAGSLERQLIKVGVCGDVNNRMYSMNWFGYGGATDWELLSYIETQKAGKAESEVHRRLAGYSKPVSYYKQGSRVDCLELFACSYKIAAAAVQAVVPAGRLIRSQSVTEEQLAAVYAFADRASSGAVRRGNTRANER
ncbi:MAG: GIY-YIG nuclease family protein [Magnetospirillum sp.]|nr:GIY-YIG nuclease family protein [Magnetospirillum sp.]